MNPTATVFFIVASALLLLLPRKFAPVPLLAGACYMTLAQGVQLGQLSFPVLRMLIAVGVLRVVIRRETLPGPLTLLDACVATLAGVAILTSIFHREPSATFVSSLGLAYNVSGIYFLLRLLCHSIEDAVHVVKATAAILLPVAVEMAWEVNFVQNLFAAFGGVPQMPSIRDGRVRAQGPFAHAILAGTVGAVCFPMMIGLWRLHRPLSIIGVASCISIVITSASSGPLLSMLAAIVALLSWMIRRHMRFVRWGLVCGYGLLALVMKAPPYALIGRIDLTGSSAGWHRVELIDAALSHITEWWRFGTDYTRHWMPTGVTWSPDHTDITNYYLHLGVVGGLPLMLAFIAMLVQAYSLSGRNVHNTALPHDYRFMAWTFGAALFAHTATCISVSYFDQSFLFLYMNLAVIGAVHAGALRRLENSPHTTSAMPVTDDHCTYARRWRPVSRPRWRGTVALRHTRCDP